MPRFDGREDNQLRPIKMKVGVIENADGSAFFQIGNTKVVAGVYGPRELHPRHLQDPEKAILRVQYRMATFSVPDRADPRPTRRAIELSKVIGEALKRVVYIEEFPRAVIDVFILVLQADAGTRCASLTAASMALADAGVPMRDLIAAVAAGKVGQRIVLDLNKMEEDYGKLVPPNDYYGPGTATDVPVGYSPLLDEFVLCQLDGWVTKEELDKILELAKEGCMKIYELEKKAIKDKYVLIEEESVEV